MNTLSKDNKILVVCGGFSSEREISLLSGRAIYQALLKLGYKNASLFDLARDNAIDIIKQKPDMVYIALHGKGGEDGSIQGFLEWANIPYTGPGICSSAVCMNKVVTKRFLESAGLPTAKFEAYYKDDIKDIDIFSQHIKETFGLPLIFKPSCQGSSIGIVMVRKEEDIQNALEEVFKYGYQLLVEQFLDGVELSLPIMGNEHPMALPIIEIVSEREFIDYETKYTKGLCQHIIPACIDEVTAKQVEAIGLEAYRLLNCRGLSRIDFIVDKTKGPMIIEVDTLPGMTAMSLFPAAARFMGISFEELVEKTLLLGYEAKRDLID